MYQNRSTLSGITGDMLARQITRMRTNAKWDQKMEVMQVARKGPLGGIHSGMLQQEIRKRAQRQTLIRNEMDKAAAANLEKDMQTLQRGDTKPDLSPQLLDYMVKRSVMNRKFETQQTNRLMSADMTVRETRDILSVGRGNVYDDLDRTNNKSAWLLKAGRKMRKQLDLDNPHASPGVNSALAAMMMRAGNCGEHGTIATHLDAKRLQTEHRTKESSNRVSSKDIDHGWSERRRKDGKERATDILMDAWAEGSAVERVDSAFGDNVKRRYKYHTENMPKQDFTQMRDQVSKRAWRKAQKKYNELKVANYKPDDDHLWDPTDVYSDDFLKNSKTAMEELGSEEKLKKLSDPHFKSLFDKKPGHLVYMRVNQDKRNDLFKDIHTMGVLRTAGASIKTANSMINE